MMMPSEVIERLREQLFDAALPHIPFDGWTVESLELGVADLGLDRLAVVRAFPGGSTDMIKFHSARTDARMLEILADRSLSEMRVRDRITTGVRVRLELLTVEREAMRCALSFLAMPQNTVLAMRCLYKTVDSIWHAAGDTATDWNFYSKRGLLAAVYSTTLFCWLNDDSEGFTETWAFLDRRISTVLKVPKAVMRCREMVPNPLRFFRGRRAA
jgi:ubiquinone biosynthesis protein COQ9